MNWQITKNTLPSIIWPASPADLNEDLYQAERDNCVIDSGWYDNEDGGVFVTYLIKDRNWERPLLRLETLTPEDAKWAIAIFEDYCQKVVFR